MFDNRYSCVLLLWLFFSSTSRDLYLSLYILHVILNLIIETNNRKALTYSIDIDVSALKVTKSIYVVVNAMTI